MRAVRTIGLAIAVTGLAATAAAPVAAASTYPRYNDNVRIATTHYRAMGRGLNGEWVKFTNNRGYPVDLRGWTLTERYFGHRYTFPDKWLAPGASVWLRSGRGLDRGANLYWDSRTYVWNNHVDSATLRNARSTVIDTCGWKSRTGSQVHCSN